MTQNTRRVLGRLLAVEETREVSGGQREISTIIDVDVNTDTRPLDDATTAQYDSGTSADTGATADSGTIEDTGATADSGTVEDTGPLMDCIGSGTRREICLAPFDL